MQESLSQKKNNISPVVKATQKQNKKEYGGKTALAHPKQLPQQQKKTTSSANNSDNNKYQNIRGSKNIGT